MFLGHPDRWAELSRRAMLFDDLGTDLRIAILRRAARNDLRGVARPDSDHLGAMTALAQPEPASLGEVLRATVSFVPEPSALASLSRLLRQASGPAERWDALELVATEVFGMLPRPDRWLGTLALNSVLTMAGHVPVAGYAFGRWHLPHDRPPDRHQLFALVELATCYFYRLSPTPLAPGEPPGQLAGRGAYSEVYRSGGLAVKVARNLASEAFALRQEALLLRQVCGSRARRYVAAFADHDDRRGLLFREFVPGPTGHELLRDARFEAEPELRDRLLVAYREITAYLKESGSRLDLHPGNFVWDQAQRRWVLVDLGPVPAIGSDYYDLESFDTYLRDTWLRRLERMRTEPIRSLDWE